MSPDLGLCWVDFSLLFVVWMLFIAMLADGSKVVGHIAVVSPSSSDVCGSLVSLFHHLVLEAEFVVFYSCAWWLCTGVLVSSCRYFFP